MSMFKDLTPKQEQEYLQWARDNYHTKVGLSGEIKGFWHPVVRQEMQRLHQLQVQAIKNKMNQ